MHLRTPPLVPIRARGRFGAPDQCGWPACLRRSGSRPALALAPLAAALRSGGRRLRRFSLEPNGAAARLEYLHQALGERLACGFCPTRPMSFR